LAGFCPAKVGVDIATACPRTAVQLASWPLPAVSADTHFMQSYVSDDSDFAAVLRRCSWILATCTQPLASLPPWTAWTAPGASAAGRCSFGLFVVRVVIAWRLFRRSTPETREPILIVGFGRESTGALLSPVDFAKDDAGFARRPPGVSGQSRIHGFSITPMGRPSGRVVLAECPDCWAGATSSCCCLWVVGKRARHRYVEIARGPFPRFAEARGRCRPGRACRSVLTLWPVRDRGSPLRRLGTAWTSWELVRESGIR
jgi:hypothetical protein